MVNLVDLQWLKQCHAKLKDMVEDSDFAELIIKELDKDEDLREELSYVYVKALKTAEKAKLSRKK